MCPKKNPTVSGTRVLCLTIKKNWYIMKVEKNKGNLGCFTGEAPFFVWKIKKFMAILKKKLNKRRIASFSILMIAVFLVFSTGRAFAGDITVDKVVQLVNQERESAGLDSLTVNQYLLRAAKNKALDMFKNNYFAHTSPSGATPWHWIEESGYDYKFAGENLAINFTNVEEQHKAWMESLTHRKNILNQKYKEIGVAAEEGYIDGRLTTVTVQMFGSRYGAILKESSINKPEIKGSVKINSEEPAGSEEGGHEILKKEKQETQNSAGQIAFTKKSSGDLLSENNNGACLPIKNAMSNPLSLLKSGNSLCGDNFAILEKSAESVAWLMVLLSILTVAIFNSMAFFHKSRHHHYIAANTVILMIALTALIFRSVQ